MNYKKYQDMFRSVGIASAFLMLVACGENDADKATDTATSTEVTAASTNTGNASSAPVDRSVGTWGDIVYGSEDAPVTVIEYASLTCPHCAGFAREIFPQIKKEFIDTGKIKFVYRNFLLNRVDMAASTVARCGDMKQTKKLMSVYFSRQNEWMRAENPQDALASLARRTVNMSRTDFDRCLSNVEMHKNLVAMTSGAADQYNISSTPQVVVNGEVTTDYSFETIKKAIEAEL